MGRMAGRLREGLLRDNKVIPPVLGALALIIFAWIVAGALIGAPPDGDREQIANQANQPSGNLAQNPDDAANPGVDNRDAESFSQFDSKDPFGDLQYVTPADQGGTTGGDTTGGDTTGTNQYGSTTGEDTTGGGGGGGQDFIDQTFPGGGDGGTGSGGGGGGSGGDEDLFDSGGDLGP